MTHGRIVLFLRGALTEINAGGLAAGKNATTSGL